MPDLQGNGLPRGGTTDPAGPQDLPRQMQGLRRQGKDYGRQLRRPIFAYLSNIDHADCPKQSMLRVMTLEATKLTREEFASLLTVGNAHVRSPAPAIPAEHSARLIALGLHG